MWYSALVKLDETGTPAPTPGGGGDSGNTLILPDATFIVELILFLVILVILGKFVVPPVLGALRERAAVIARQKSAAEEADAKVAESVAAHDKVMADARAETSRLREEARAHHREKVAEAAAAAAQEAEAATARTREALTSERESALSALQGDIEGMADQLANRLIGERV